MPSVITPKAKLSRDASHLVRRAEAGRDHLVLASVSVGALAGMGANAAVQQMGPWPLAAAVIGVVGAGYVAARTYLSLRATDEKLAGLAIATDQEAAPKGTLGLINASDVFRIVRTADPIAPDMVKSIANRRARRWDAVLDQNYRPPARPGQPGA